MRWYIYPLWYTQNALWVQSRVGICGCRSHDARHILGNNLLEGAVIGEISATHIARSTEYLLWYFKQSGTGRRLASNSVARDAQRGFASMAY